jgi:hypothetical protein
LASLIIAFEDGFLDDSVMVSVNNRQVYSKQKVTTKRIIGLAASTEIKGLQEGEIMIDIKVPSKSLSKQLPLKVSQRIYLMLSIHNGKLVHRISDQPIGYM